MQFVKAKNKITYPNEAIFLVLSDKDFLCVHSPRFEADKAREADGQWISRTWKPNCVYHLTEFTVIEDFDRDSITQVDKSLIDYMFKDYSQKEDLKDAIGSLAKSISRI